MATPNNQIRLFETRTYLKQDAPFTGTESVEFYAVSGSRMLTCLKVLTCDPGTTVTLAVGNTSDRDIGYDALEQVQLTAAGDIKRVYSDFFNQFKLTVTVAGGNATYRVIVAFFDNAGTTRIENADLKVDINHTVDSLGHFDSVRIGDGTDLLAINPDGSINVVIADAMDEDPISAYGESPATPTGTPAAVVTYVVPADKIAFLYRVEASGENVARYQVTVNDTVIATRRTHHGSGLTTDFNFDSPNKRTLILQPGDIIKLVALHNRPESGDFEARVELLLKTAP